MLKGFFDPPPSVTFVLGTDTGVGKTRVMIWLCRSFPPPGGIAMVKAVQTGTGEEGGVRDVETYRTRGRVPPDLLWEGDSFLLPLDPMTAATHEGRRVDPDSLLEGIRAFHSAGRDVLVEGTGGILSPFFQDGSGILTLIHRLDLPVRTVLVGHPHLGCLSQILSSVRILREERREPAAILLCPRPGVSDEATTRNPGTIRKLLPGIPLFLLGPDS